MESVRKIDPKWVEREMERDPRVFSILGFDDTVPMLQSVTPAIDALFHPDKERGPHHRETLPRGSGKTTALIIYAIHKMVYCRGIDVTLVVESHNQARHVKRRMDDLIRSHLRRMNPFGYMWWDVSEKGIDLKEHYGTWEMGGSRVRIHSLVDCVFEAIYTDVLLLDIDIVNSNSHAYSETANRSRAREVISVGTIEVPHPIRL